MKRLYLKILFVDYEAATSASIETSLWQHCFYKVIEKHRSEIRMASNEIKQIRTDSPAKNEKSETLRNRCEVFRKFLESSTEFYQKIIRDFQTTYNLRLDSWLSEPEKGSLSKQYATCHRCLIILGDLARYQRDLVSSPTKSQWVNAEPFYLRALQLWPENGHPHNQLAVLWSYREDDFLTFYHYMRSLAVEIRFGTASENIVGLFEKVKAKLGKMTDLMPKTEFILNFIRLHSLLFTKTSLEGFKKSREGLLNLFEKLLIGGEIDEATILRMFLSNIFAIHNSESDPEAAQAHHHAICLAMDFFSHVLQQSKLAITKRTRNVTFSDIDYDESQHSNETESRNDAFYMAISVFSAWLTHHPQFLKTNQETPIWLRLRELVVEVSNQVLSVNENAHGVDERAPLPEDIECQGFLPLKASLQSIDYSLPVINEGPECSRRRRAKIIQLSHLACDHDWNDNEPFIYFNTELNKFYTTNPHTPPVSPIPSLPSSPTKVQPAPTPSAPKPSAPPSVPLDDFEDDIGDVILFTPSPLQNSTKVVGSERAQVEPPGVATTAQISNFNPLLNSWGQLNGQLFMNREDNAAGIAGQFQQLSIQNQQQTSKESERKPFSVFSAEHSSNEKGRSESNEEELEKPPGIEDSTSGSQFYNPYLQNMMSNPLWNYPQQNSAYPTPPSFLKEMPPPNKYWT
uniref:DNA/RNA-binding domain-containing protein n=1 Tax=Arcella intermedia TaxID=1963864 RepID=A0A6B2KYR4_9EUKA